ncbi:phenylalanine tRNA synthetase alpha subunit [Erysipelotrichaceae bacterium]|nr:phenylalanine tRNA synthetase alpha subunit [Erysipelotrichaceae bacterium]
MNKQLQEMLDNAKNKISEITDANEFKKLEEIRIQFLGKKGPIQEVMQQMRTLTNEQRKEMGQYVNTIKTEISALVDAKKAELEIKIVEEKIASESIDITLPGRIMPKYTGFHPLNQIVRDIEDFFSTMGYQTIQGPEVELDYYNFEAVNIPKNHPARDMQDTFYISPEQLLRTHTSGVQARTLEKADVNNFPIKFISPGKVYRRDDDDATHSHQFMQIEGMYIGENISMAQLRGTLQAFVDHLFGEGRKIRMRPSYFPFVEPGVEVDVSCAKCGGSGCNICKGPGYIEILGAGLVHPQLLEIAGIDSAKYSGFAFGMGPDRVAMLKYGVEDIRNFYTNDLNFLKQFNR